MHTHTPIRKKSVPILLLHVEITVIRIFKEFKLDIKMGPSS